MTAAETTTETEQERIVRWRAGELERAGYEASAARGSRAGPTSISTTRSTCSVGCARNSPLLTTAAKHRALVLPAPSAFGPRLGRMRSAVTLLASIPSPSSGTIDLGPITIHMYGLMLLAGIAACIFITGKRWVARGGDWDLIFRVAVWGVGAGIVGARLYHLATSWSEVPDEWWGPFAVWEGGLGIWGGDRRRHPRRRDRREARGRERHALLDAAAPGLLVAQGDRPDRQLVEPGALRRADRPPWGLRIDASRRPDEYIFSETFHPTFLYEALWNFAAARLLLLLTGASVPPAGALRALRLALHRLPLLPRDDPDRPVRGDRRPPRERVGLAGSLRRVDRVLRLLAVLPRPQG